MNLDERNDKVDALMCKAQVMAEQLREIAYAIQADIDELPDDVYDSESAQLECLMHLDVEYLNSAADALEQAAMEMDSAIRPDGYDLEDI